MEKEKLNKDKSIELRSEELQDLIGRMPFCFERYGIIVLAAIVLIIISGTYFFKYPDTLDAQIVITNSTPAANIVARTAGNLEYINTNNGGIVAVGEVLAVIANTANYKDVIQLENVIEKVEVQEMNIEEFVSWMNTNMLRLGNMQHYYVTLHNAARNLYYYNVNNYYQKKNEIIHKRLEQHHEMEDKEHHLHKLQERLEQISHDIFLRDSMLYISGLLSEEAYGKAEQIYMQSCRGPFDREVEEVQHRIRQTNEQETLLDLANEQFMTANNYEQAFHSALQDIIMVTKNWEETFVMRSPTKGTLNQMGLLGKNRYVSSGETLFFVTPQKQEKPVGKALLPASGAGKVRKGQRVIVSVNNFPEEEFGCLTGIVSSISDTPTIEGNYIVDITFPNGLNTVFHKELPSSQQFIGTARLIVKDRRLIELFIQPVKIILTNNT